MLPRDDPVASSSFGKIERRVRLRQQFGGRNGRVRMRRRDTHRDRHAAVFRRGAPGRSSLRDALSFMATALGRRPGPEQGLLLAKEFYVALGGHPDGADREAGLIRGIGRRRIVTLPAIAYSADILD